jgi:Domain of unknown function (DUF4180)
MELKIQKLGQLVVAEVLPDNIKINNLDDFIDILGNAYYLGAEMILISKNNISDDFFDLKTGLAGEILQKFSNYRQKLAILGQFSEVKSKSLKDFIFESNKTGRILFLENKEQLIELLKQK